MDEQMKQIYAGKLINKEAAAAKVSSGDRVYIGTCTSTAYGISRALGERIDELEDITILCSNINKPLRIMSGENPTFKINSYFMGSQERQGIAKGITDFTTFHLSQVDVWVKDIAKPDVSFIEVSSPDEDGYMTFGASGVCLGTYLLEASKKIILQVNKYAPYVYGEYNKVHVSQADYIVEDHEELFTVGDMPISPELETISKLLIDEVKDGDCLQFGIGGLANAVGYGLKDKNDLSCHTELIGDSLKFLMENGNNTNKYKKYIPGKTTVSFALGTPELYRFLDHNEDVHFLPMPIINNPANIAKNDNVVSVNTALSIDLMGQVVADNIDGRQYSGVGGQIDFVRGAQMSKGGRSYIAVTSTFDSSKTGRGSRIVPCFKLGTAVTTPRSEVQYIVTEFGCINLKTLTMKDRVRAMISLAHPDFRDELTEEAKRMKLL
ncbi:MAG: acetyl-CoA hydrolase [Alphaproteobacteria bacterium]|nr:acetyl-CoA hydrolase [Alphaproteobacteria bacterium]